MKKKMIQFIFVILVLITASVIFNCDTTKSQHPYTIINVHLTPVVSPSNKLYVVFHFLNDWASPWLTLSSDSNTIIIPPLNVGKIPLYFEIIYDNSGTGNPATTNNWYQGWSGKTDRTVPDLSVFIVPNVPLMILNIEMDDLIAPPVTNHGLMP